MNIMHQLIDGHLVLGRWLDRLQSLLLLATRCYVGWQFSQSGWLKVTSWDSTLGLFRDEYHVPFLSPHLAAIVGTFGELFFPVLLYLGLFSRVGALGLFAVNAMAVISYRQVLLAEGFEAALGNHVLWGFMSLVLIVMGPGRIALDSWLQKQISVSAVASGRPAAVV